MRLQLRGGRLNSIVVAMMSSSSALSSSAAFYRIGTPGVAWGDAERTQWREQTKVQRSYKSEVLDKLKSWMKDRPDGPFDLVEYGSLSHDPQRYPLVAVKSKAWDEDKPCVLITGGTHGYETSGVQGALQFLQSDLMDAKYVDRFNFVIAPCLSPWSYETIQRWTFTADDPNRSFRHDDDAQRTEESRALMRCLHDELCIPQWMCHLDLHETTDTDATEFRPARDAKEGKAKFVQSGIPDGFYLVADAPNPQFDWQAAIIESVRKVTHIAPPDDADANTIIGMPVVREGIIAVDTRQYGLCACVTNAKYCSTTEVYPDSPSVTDAICNDAQVAAIDGALRYILENEGSKEEP